MTSENEILNINTLPSPKGTPIVGHLPKFNAANKHNVLEGWVKESGELYKINLLGKKFIVSADPEINSFILRNRPGKFRRFYKINEIMEEMGITGVFNAEDEQSLFLAVIPKYCSISLEEGKFNVLASPANKICPFHNCFSNRE